MDGLGLSTGKWRVILFSQCTAFYCTLYIFLRENELPSTKS